MRRRWVIAFALVACGRLDFEPLAPGDGGSDGSGDGGGGAPRLAYIKASNAESFDQFGGRVALSADGLTLAVSAIGESGPANAMPSAGAVYVFVRTGDTWSEQAILRAAVADDADFFGNGLAISADGSTIAIGAPLEDSAATAIDGSQTDDSAMDAGAAYVFVRTGASWAQQAYVKAANADANDNFGIVVALSASGDVLAVGTELEDSSDVGVGGTGADDLAIDSGAVYTFARTGTTWTATGYLKASNAETDDRFGAALALSGDGIRLVVGAPQEDSDATTIDGNQADNSSMQTGAAYAFVYVDPTWVQEAYLKPPAIDFGDYFGKVLAFSADGQALAVSSPGEDTVVLNSGGVFTFTRSGSTWSQRELLKALDPGDGDTFGYSLTIRANGSDVFVSAPYEDSDATGIGGVPGNDNRSDSGAVFAYSRVPDALGWMTGLYRKAAHPSPGDAYGQSIAVSADARTIATSMAYDDSAATGIDGDPTDESGTDCGAVEVRYFGQ